MESHSVIEKSKLPTPETSEWISEQHAKENGANAKGNIMDGVVYVDL